MMIWNKTERLLCAYLLCMRLKCMYVCANFSSNFCDSMQSWLMPDPREF